MDTPDPAQQKKTPDPVPQAYPLARALGIIVKNTMTRCWLSRRDAQQVIDTAYALLARALAQHEEIVVQVLPTSLSVNGAPLRRTSPETQSLVDQLNHLEVKRFTIVPGGDEGEFARLVDVLSRRPETVLRAGGFAAVLAAEHIDHVRARKVVYREVAEDQVIVDRADHESEERAAQASVSAVLQGTPPPDGDPQDTAAAVRDAAGDPQQLADMIVDVVQEGESDAIGDSISGCVRRVFEVLNKDPSARTQKGKKELARSLARIEGALVEVLRGPDAAEPGAEGRVTTAIGQMQEEIRIDAITAEYLRKRRAIEESEARILRFIRTRGPDMVRRTDLPERLLEGGLDVDDWVTLLDRSGALDSPAGAKPVDGAASELDKTLENLGSSLPAQDGASGDADRERLTKTLHEVNRSVDGLVADTRAKIRDLAVAVEEGETDGPHDTPRQGTGKRAGMSRKRLLAVLAEIVQEACQPLSVIKCVVEMLCSRLMGEVSDSQEEMLRLAAESASKINVLIDDLRRISGEPDSLSPDAAVQASLYADSSAAG